ncbi:MAG TPA: DsbA family protein [Anaeromyxobacter sp.]|nr:DsbA family protein [Anaeromyxobacter sp.]
MRAVRPLLVLLSVAASACGQSKSNDTLAKFGNEAITAEQVNKEAAQRLEDIEGRFRQAKNDYETGVYQAKLGAIEKIVNEKIFTEMGKEKGITADQAREQKYQEFVDKQPMPSEEEQRAYYDQKQREQNGQLGPFEEMQPQVVQRMRMEAAGPSAQAWYEDYKKQKGYKLLLEPFRQKVDASGPSKGNAKAPITIVEFSDFQCPYCARAEPTLAKVLADYGDKVRLVFRDFPLDFHKEAQKASEAAHCAGDQGKYWEMHGKLFASQQQLDVDSLKRHARDLELDGAKFDECLTSGAKAQLVKDHFQAGREIGVQATPAFFINGRPLSGAVPYEQFKAIIDDELSRK